MRRAQAITSMLTLASTIAACGARTAPRVPSLADAHVVVDAGTDAWARRDAGPTRAPRPIAPLSTSTSTVRRPTFEWELPPGTDAATLWLCDEATCAHARSTRTVRGTRSTPETPLAPGVWFWRLWSGGHEGEGDYGSPIWTVRVGPREAAHDQALGTVLDLNRDGYADVAIASHAVVEVHLGSASGPSTAPDATLPYPRSEIVGSWVASAGDVNGDGYADLAIGSYDGASDDGRLAIYFGSSAGVAAEPSQVLAAPEPRGMFGIAVASAGDLDHDGYGDVVIGARDAERVYVHRGSRDGLLADASQVLVASTPGIGGSMFGHAVAAGGDVDGDGHPDVAVGAYLEIGGVYLFAGDRTGLAPSAASMLRPSTWGLLYFGSSLSMLDLNADGIADLVVGAYGTAPGEATGAVFVYLGSTRGLADPPALVVPGPDGTWGNFGDTVADAGDLDGDGYGDVVASARGADQSTGHVHALYGASGGLDRTRATVITGPDAAGGNFGWGLGGAGDVDGDGFADVIAGAPLLDDAGRAYWLRGGPRGVATSPALAFIAPTAGQWFGGQVARR